MRVAAGKGATTAGIALVTLTLLWLRLIPAASPPPVPPAHLSHLSPSASLAPLAPPALQVTDASSGRTLAVLPIAGDARMQLHYLHSVYRQPAVEEFAVAADGLRLVRLASPSVAVLEYYARAEPVTPVADGLADGIEGGVGAAGYEIRLDPQVQAPSPRLELLVSEVGRRTLVYAGRELPLHRLAGDGARVGLAVSGIPAEVNRP